MGRWRWMATKHIPRGALIVDLAKGNQPPDVAPRIGQPLGGMFYHRPLIFLEPTPKGLLYKWEHGMPVNEWQQGLSPSNFPLGFCWTWDDWTPEKGGVSE